MVATDVSAALTAFLTHLNTQDPGFIAALLQNRFKINNEAIHVITPDAEAPYTAGFIGVVNGFLDSIGQPRIAFIEQDNGKITGFTPVGPTWKTVEANGVILEVDPEVPEAEVANLKAFLEAQVKVLTVNYRAKITKLPEGVDLLLVCAIDAPGDELDALRAHIDEARVDPDYTIVTNYAVEITGRDHQPVVMTLLSPKV